VKNTTQTFHDDAFDYPYAINRGESTHKRHMTGRSTPSFSSNRIKSN